MPLESIRDELNRVDAEIVRLLDERARLGRRVGEIKRAHDLPLHHPERERAVLERVAGLSDGSFPRAALERVYQAIMAETLALQSAPVCACSGERKRGMRDVRAVVLENGPVGAGFGRMRVLAPELAGAFHPGQFFQIRVGVDGSGFFLRRPFAPSGYHDDGFSFHYAIVGAGTERLAAFGPGAEVSVLAPLGNGFTIPPKGTRAVLFGGGCGGPSLAPLAGAIPGATIFLGARTEAGLLHRDEFAKHGRLIAATDDGSFGCRGTVIDAFRQEFGGDISDVRFYACGPLGMLRAVARLAEVLGVTGCEVSLEERMACGFGACMGCAVLMRGGADGTGVFRRVCHEGPVFKASDLMWDSI